MRAQVLDKQSDRALNTGPAVLHAPTTIKQQKDAVGRSDRDEALDFLRAAIFIDQKILFQEICGGIACSIENIHVHMTRGTSTFNDCDRTVIESEDALEKVTRIEAPR